MAAGLQKIWRVENGEGRGPYGAHPESEIASLLQSLGYNSLLSDLRPGPAQDAGLAAYFNVIAANRDWVFGFQDLALYREWFADKNLRRVLAGYDYFLTGYAVPEDKMLLGARQAVFRRDCAVIREFRDCEGKIMMQDKAGTITPGMKDLMTRFRLDIA